MSPLPLLSKWCSRAACLPAALASAGIGLCFPSLSNPNKELLRQAEEEHLSAGGGQGSVERWGETGHVGGSSMNKGHKAELAGRERAGGQCDCKGALSAELWVPFPLG